MDVGFTVGPSNQSTVDSFRNINSRGAGVNAATRVNMSDMACDSLFELVWCPNKGLSMKRADYRLNKSSSSLVCDVDHGNMFLSPCNRPINEIDLNDKQEKLEEGCFEALNDGELVRFADHESQRAADKSNPAYESAAELDKNENKGSPTEVHQEKMDSALEDRGEEKEQTQLHRESQEKTTNCDGNEDDDSRESIESCSSVGLSLKGTKRLRLEQNMIGGSKRIKQKVQETPFMDWISNMMKGFRHPNHNYDDKIIKSNKNLNTVSKTSQFEYAFEPYNTRNTRLYERGIFGDSAISNTKKNHEACTSTRDSLEIQNPKAPFLWNRISNGPKEMFDAISKLRLSRSDILRWKSSEIPISNMDGFFVRLRLGKLDETRYYVASINGMPRVDSEKDSKNPISVSVWGITCVVESQYVSNHDFLEDELKSWWDITSKSGKVPKESILKLKLQQRKNLGF